MPVITYPARNIIVIMIADKIDPPVIRVHFVVIPFSSLSFMPKIPFSIIPFFLKAMPLSLKKYIDLPVFIRWLEI